MVTRRQTNTIQTRGIIPPSICGALLESHHRPRQLPLLRNKISGSKTGNVKRRLHNGRLTQTPYSFAEIEINYYPSLVCTTTSTRRLGLCSSMEPLGDARNF